MERTDTSPVILERLRRSLAFGLLGALLLASVAVGEARAVTVTPPDDDATPDDDLVRQVGGYSCNGVYGAGKIVLDLSYLGVDLSGAGSELTAVELPDGVGLEAVVLDDDLPPFVDSRDEGLFTVGIDVVDDCGASPGLRSGEPSVEDFTPKTFELPITLTVTPTGGSPVECRADLEIAWSADADSTAFGGSAEYFLWTASGGLSFGSEGVTRDDAFAAAVPNPMFDCGDAGQQVAQPVSALSLACEPAVASVGSVVTCTVTGGDPAISVLWRASASLAFAEDGVALDAEGRGTFAFRVPASVGDGPVLVELVEWDRSATVVMSSSVVPSRVPAGEGWPVGLGLLAIAALSAAALAARRSNVVLGR